MMNIWWVCVHSIQLKTKEVLLEILLKKCRPVSMDAGIVGVTLHVLPVVHILSIKLSPGDGTVIFRFTCATCILFVFNWKAKWWILSGWFSGSSSWLSWERIPQFSFCLENYLVRALFLGNSVLYDWFGVRMFVRFPLVKDPFFYIEMVTLIWAPSHKTHRMMFQLHQQYILSLSHLCIMSNVWYQFHMPLVMICVSILTWHADLEIKILFTWWYLQILYFFYMTLLSLQHETRKTDMTHPSSYHIRKNPHKALLS